MSCHVWKCPDATNVANIRYLGGKNNIRRELQEADTVFFLKAANSSSMTGVTNYCTFLDVRLTKCKH